MCRSISVIFRLYVRCCLFTFSYQSHMFSLCFLLCVTPNNHTVLQEWYLVNLVCFRKRLIDAQLTLKELSRSFQAGNLKITICDYWKNYKICVTYWNPSRVGHLLHYKLSTTSQLYFLETRLSNQPKLIEWVLSLLALRHTQWYSKKLGNKMISFSLFEATNYENV